MRGNVETKTTRFQNIFLTDDNGKDQVIELKNFLVPCTEGQKLTLVHVGEGGPGSYFRAYNHSTSQRYDNNSALNTYMFPKFIFVAVLILMVLFVYNLMGTNPDFDGFERLASTIIFSGIGLLILYALAKIFAAIRASQVLKNPAYVKFMNSLTNSS